MPARAHNTTHRRALQGDLSAPDGPAADLLERSLALAGVLAQFVGCQQQLQGALPPRLGGLLQQRQPLGPQGGGEPDGCSLVQALQAVADHAGGCDEAAGRARQLVADAAAAGDGMDVE